MRWPRPAVLGAVGLPLAAVGLAVWDPARHGGPALCPWRAVTGTSCPGCGLTRAGGALLRGRLDEAVHLHPLVLLVAAQVVLVWVMALWALRRRPIRSTSPPAWVTPVMVVEVLLFVGVWGTRLASGSLPAA
jgi:hypothetical protein